MKTEILNTIQEVAEALEWRVHISETNVEFENWSPAGENLVFSFENGTVKQFRLEIVNYYNGFDAEAHAAEWYGANRGEPESLRDLLEDADAIDGMLRELVMALTQVLKKEG